VAEIVWAPLTPMTARLLRFSLVAALAILGIALTVAALWFFGPTLALIAFLVLAVVIVPSCVQIIKESG
jgi:multisubunit Na+/H+ antiporter MnhB subunit